MDENQAPGQTPITTTEAAAHYEQPPQAAGAATPKAAAAGSKKAVTPNRLVAQVGSQMSALQQAETIKQLQGQVKQLEAQTRDAGKVFLATTTTLITSAFALVAALAWNEAIQDLFKQLFPPTITQSGGNAIEAAASGTSWGQVIGAFSYAVVVTIIVVAIIYYLTRLNTRIGARSLIGEAPKAGKEG
jgi:predicted PurR-regulated permease PerM